jgi:hypothetical protein
MLQQNRLYGLKFRLTVISEKTQRIFFFAFFQKRGFQNFRISEFQNFRISEFRFAEFSETRLANWLPLHSSQSVRKIKNDKSETEFTLNSFYDKLEQ